MKPITMYGEYKPRSRKKNVLGKVVVGKGQYMKYMKFGATENSFYK